MGAGRAPARGRRQGATTAVQPQPREGLWASLPPSLGNHGDGSDTPRLSVLSPSRQQAGDKGGLWSGCGQARGQAATHFLPWTVSTICPGGE